MFFFFVLSGLIYPPCFMAGKQLVRLDKSRSGGLPTPQYNSKEVEDESQTSNFSCR
jgi:hypothetical protein